MKDYCKNVLATYGMVALVMLIAGLLEFSLAVLYAETGLTDWAVYGIMLVVALIGGTIKTARERRRKKNAAKYVNVVLENAIEVQRSLLADATAEEPTPNNLWKRAVCRTTLAALEEKRERLIKNGGNDHGQEQAPKC